MMMMMQHTFLSTVQRTTTRSLLSFIPITPLSLQPCQSLRPRFFTTTTSFFRPTPVAAMSSDSSTLPYHLVVGLPALSPTMEVGTLSEWYKNEGDAFQAGDAIAKIETDKAAIDFEAQDDGVVAKILISSNDGSDIPVGTPIMITVEDAADVAAFKDYVHTSVPVAPAPTPTAPAVPAPSTTVAPPSPPPPPTPTVVAPPVATAAAAVVTSPSPVSASTTNTMSTAIPGIVYAKSKSPLAHTLYTSQTKYIELYGTTGQIPVS